MSKYEQLKYKYDRKEDALDRCVLRVQYLEDRNQDLEYLKNAIGSDKAEDMIARERYMEQ